MLLRLNRYGLYLRLTLYVLPAIAFVIAAFIRFWLFHSGADAHVVDYFYCATIVTALWILVCASNQLYALDKLITDNSGLRRVFGACALTYAVLIALLYLAHEQDISRLFLFVSAAVLFCLALIARLAFRNLSRRRTPRTTVRVLMVGADQYARRATRLMCSQGFVACQVIGYIRLPGQKVAVKKDRVYEIDELTAFEVNGGVDDVVIALPPERLGELADIEAKLSAISAPLRLVLDLGDGLFVRDRLFQFGRAQVLDLRTTPAELMRYAMLKRVFDVVVSTAFLLIASPLMIAIATAIKLTSPGPVLFVQERVGLNSRTFRMYKFRSMRVAPKQDGDTKWTTPDDPRRTPIGTFLRKTSLDELPQFFNVLKGDMSIVGPRPERPHFVRKFLSEVGDYNARHRLKVGITGWAQVNGLRGDTSIAKRVQYDLFYLQNWSLMFDLQIIARTFVSVFGDRNAY